MLNVTKFFVRSFDLDRLDLFWEIAQVPGPSSDGSRHEIFDYEFSILRAGDSPMGPFELIGGPLRDVYQFRDVKVSLLHKWRQYFYKLHVLHKPSGEVQEFGPVPSGDSPPDLIAAEIIRQEDKLFREFIGRRCWLYPVRTFGPRCSCYDATLTRITRTSHLPCYGTGWLGGFMSPVEVWVQIDPNGKQVQLSALQEGQATNTTARTSSFPPINPRDILIESENTRWRVVSVHATERLRAIVHQELVLKALPRGDIEYALPVNVDLSKLEPAAKRNFTNPHNPDGDLQDILSFFGHSGRPVG